MRIEQALRIAATARRPKRSRVPDLRRARPHDPESGRFLPAGAVVALPISRAGRPVGSRNLLSQALLENLAQDWHEYGPRTLERLRQRDPHGYLRIIGSLMLRLTPLVDDDEADDAAAVADQVKQARSRDQLIELVRARGGARAFEGFKRLVALLDEYPELKGVIYR